MMKFINVEKYILEIKVNFVLLGYLNNDLYYKNKWENLYIKIL